MQYTKRNVYLISLVLETVDEPEDNIMLDTLLEMIEEEERKAA
jgi:hypothetical protein